MKSYAVGDPGTTLRSKTTKRFDTFGAAEDYARKAIVRGWMGRPMISLRGEVIAQILTDAFGAVWTDVQQDGAMLIPALGPCVWDARP